MTSFADLGVPSELCHSLKIQGIVEPFPIQAATLPDSLAGRDVLGRGQTGSGKTLAFALPMVTRLAGETSRPGAPRGLILVPTRELAMQVCDTLRPLAEKAHLRVGVIVGGMSYKPQMRALERGADILVATPGRLDDLVNQGVARLDETSIVVLDEADHMSDLGFMPQVTALLDLVPAGGQRLLFSATLDRAVDRLVKRYLHEPIEHSVAPATSPVQNMDHHVMVVKREHRAKVIGAIANREGRTIMFVRTQIFAENLTASLHAAGVGAGALHGGKSQAQRNRTLEDFKSGITPVLVATDVAARGIHVDDISLVLHVDPAGGPKDYLHRSGRTARAGTSGQVLTLATPQQRRAVLALTKQAGVDADLHFAEPGDEVIIDLTGAREPSGIPWEPPRRPRERNERGDRNERRPRSDHGSRRDWNTRSRKPRTNEVVEFGERDTRVDRFKKRSRHESDGDQRPSGGDRWRTDESRPRRTEERGEDGRDSRSTRPGPKSGSKPYAKSGSKPYAKSGSKPYAKSDTRSDSRPDTRSDSRPGDKSSFKSGKPGGKPPRRTGPKREGSQGFASQGRSSGGRDKPRGNR